MLNKDLIQDVDFGALYQEQCRRSSFGPRTSADWDRRAERRSHRELDNDYSRAFLERMDLSGAKTALDIGCGTGNLALPLAKRLRKVHALDFSPAMLRYLEKNRKQAGVENIRIHRLSWTDSWAKVPKVDIAICSRALGVDDLRGALEKMTRKAKLRCCATIHAGGSYLGDDVLKRLDREMEPRPDYIYAVNILYQMGFKAKIDFIRSTGGMGYESADEFLRAIQWRIGTLSATEDKRLRQFYRGLPREADGSARYRHDFEWAMLSWETAR